MLRVTDLLKIEDIEIDGIDHSDYPDYCDAFIVSGRYEGRDLSEDELDFINNSCQDFVYKVVLEKIY